jgi:hypothetical protein
LVVIGVILILMGLLVYGFKHVMATAAMRETFAELKICSGMLTEYSNHNGLNNVEAFAAAQVNDPNAAAPGLFPVFQDPASSLAPAYYTLTWKTGATAGTYWPALVAPASLPVSSAPGGDDFTAGSTPTTDLGSSVYTPSPRYACHAVNWTRDVLYILLRVPANRNLLQSVQSKRILEPVQNTTTTIDQGAVLLDGWGNPIIFVPRGGMHTWILNPASTTSTTPTYQLYLVRSTGTFAITGNQDPPMTGAERPFFASAGEDADFTLGNDNVYSFQQ